MGATATRRPTERLTCHNCGATCVGQNRLDKHERLCAGGEMITRAAVGATLKQIAVAERYGTPIEQRAAWRQLAEEAGVIASREPLWPRERETALERRQRNFITASLPRVN